MACAAESGISRTEGRMESAWNESAPVLAASPIRESASVSGQARDCSLSIAGNRVPGGEGTDWAMSEGC